MPKSNKEKSDRAEDRLTHDEIKFESLDHLESVLEGGTKDFGDATIESTLRHFKITEENVHSRMLKMKEKAAKSKAQRKEQEEKLGNVARDITLESPLEEDKEDYTLGAMYYQAPGADIHRNDDLRTEVMAGRTRGHESEWNNIDQNLNLTETSLAGAESETELPPLRQPGDIDYNFNLSEDDEKEEYDIPPLRKAASPKKSATNPLPHLAEHLELANTIKAALDSSLHQVFKQLNAIHDKIDTLDSRITALERVLASQKTEMTAMTGALNMVSKSVQAKRLSVEGLAKKYDVTMKSAMAPSIQAQHESYQLPPKRAVDPTSPGISNKVHLKENLDMILDYMKKTCRLNNLELEEFAAMILTPSKDDVKATLKAHGIPSTVATEDAILNWDLAGTEVLKVIRGLYDDRAPSSTAPPKTITWEESSNSGRIKRRVLWPCAKEQPA